MIILFGLIAVVFGLICLPYLGAAVVLIAYGAAYLAYWSVFLFFMLSLSAIIWIYEKTTSLYRVVCA